MHDRERHSRRNVQMAVEYSDMDLLGAEEHELYTVGDIRVFTKKK